MGALTELLIAEKCRLIAVDTDERVIEHLTEKYNEHNFELIHSDIRLIDLNGLLKKYNSSKIKIIGNIPYNISSDISFWLFENSALIQTAVIMFQKEVAQRFTAKTRTKDYGILTVALDLTGTAKILFDVSPNCFYPKPEVTSSVVKFVFKNEINENFSEIMTLVKSAFNQRRKTLRNALKVYVENMTGSSIDEIIKSSASNKFVGELPPDVFFKRAEELTVGNFIGIYNFLTLGKKKNKDE